MSEVFLECARHGEEGGEASHSVGCEVGEISKRMDIMHEGAPGTEARAVAFQDLRTSGCHSGAPLPGKGELEIATSRDQWARDSDQYAMLFGAVSAVYAWDRLGGALAAILQHFLVIPCSRYVDDLFWADYSASADSGRVHALRFISLLGFAPATDKTPPAAQIQDVLGISTSLAGPIGS